MSNNQAYMREYMRQRRADRVRVAVHSRLVKASAYDIGRHDLRDGSGRMYPERYSGDAWNPVAIAAEVATGLRRRNRTPQPRQRRPVLGGKRSARADRPASK
jgi:hypothetical protein